MPNRSHHRTNLWRAVIILFVDRGGTSTKVWVRKKVSRLPCDLPNLIPALRRYLKKMPIKPAQALVGSRGVWTKPERAALRRKLSFLAKNVSVVSDIELAHYLTFGEKPGIVLNAGTGSIAWGRNENGKTARAGGLGPMLGDEGSAFWMGREYVKATKDTAFLRTLRNDHNGVKKIAAYAQKVLTLKSSVARKIQDEAIGHLEDLVIKVQTILKNKKPTPVVLRGGLFNNNRFRNKLTTRLRTLRFRV